MSDNFKHGDMFYSDYKTISPFKTYKNNMRDYAERQHGIKLSDEQFKDFVTSNGFIDPTVTYYNRDIKTFDKEIDKCKMSAYINSIYNENLVVLPTLTCYRKDIMPLDAKWTDANVSKRNEYKKAAKRYEQIGDIVNYKIYNNLQQTKKIKNNSLSGTYSLKNSPLHVLSAHNTLTSLTRMTSGIGNILTERMIAGNRFYRLKDDVINEFSTYISNSNMDKVKEAVDKYELHIPTYSEVLAMVKESSRWYWEDKIYMSRIYQYIKSLNDYERVLIMYAQDLYHMFKYNNDFITKFFGKLTRQVIGEGNDVEILKSGDYDILNALHMIHYRELSGVELNYDKYKNKPIAESMVSTYINMKNTLNEYQLYIDAFFKDVLAIPSNVTYVKEMVRKVIVLSDTDSTCGSYFGLLKKNGEVFRLDAKYVRRLSGLVLFISKNLIHNLRLYTANTNTEPELYEKISMKAEYVWSIFLPALGSKHYLTSEIIKELFIRPESKVDVSGVTLIASNLPEYFANKFKEFRAKITSTQENGNKLSIRELVNEIIQLEQYIETKLKTVPHEVVRTDKIQPEAVYKHPWNKSNYFHYILWDKIFSSKYGKSPDAPYRAYKIPLVINNKTQMREYIDNLDDKTMAKNWEELLKDADKDNVKLLRLPVTNIKGKGVPLELRDIIDYKRTILDIMKPWYMIMESLGVIKYEDRIYSELFDI